ncbi:TetR/AcrR family transcriptional regulator [Kitasatospora sp. NPDC002965]|uniref:TetR/AcrR family transcriptional regulator n=1 Tax=Kitasatospora sp. NPDC002965 TaxID=3154775 RepID=UPI0033B44367
MTDQDSTTGLRGRLVTAGVELVTREGVHALTLREIARQAGVSHGAPRRYFATHVELLAAIARRGFDDLAASLGLAGPAADPDPVGAGGPAAARAALGRLARGYLDFAAAQPGMFELMFRHDVLEGSGSDLRRTTLPLFEVIARLVAEARPDTAGRTGGPGPYAATPPGVPDPAGVPDPVTAAAAFWANLHGLAQLRAWGTLRLVTGTDTLEPLLRAALDAHLGPEPR